MRRAGQSLFRIDAFRIGLAAGLFFALLHLWEVASRKPIPIVTPLEDALRDLKFHERFWLSGVPPHEEKVVVAAIDETSMARYGRFPWDRRILARLVDALSAAGAAAIGFDITLSDEDLSGQFASGKRFRQGFEAISLSGEGGNGWGDALAGAHTHLEQAGASIDALRTRLGSRAPALLRSARDEVAEGDRQLLEGSARLRALAAAHAAYAEELDRDLVGADPDRTFAEAVARSGRVVIGGIAFLPSELQSFGAGRIDEELRRVAASALHVPEWRDGVLARPLQGTIAGVKHYYALRGPVPVIARAATAFGFFNAVPDDDGVIRSVPLAIEVRGTYLPSLELSIVAMVLGVKPSRIVPVARDESAGLLRGIDLDGKAFIPTDERGLLRVNYLGKDTTDRATGQVRRIIPHHSIADLLDGKVPASSLRGKAVLVAATAEGTFDQRVTPFESITPGVAVHAHAVQTILDGRYLRAGGAGKQLEVLAAFALAVLFAFLFSRVRVSLALPVLLGAVACVHLGSDAFFRAGIEVFEALPLFELGGMFVLVTVYRYATEEKDKRQLRKTFQLYLNPEVMDEMLQQPEKLQLGGEERELTVLFSDIRGFTGISERLSPQALVHLLNGYLSPMTDIVFAQRGTLDKYIGDALMAFFGAPLENPRHALDCCEAALQMMETLARLREDWRRENPELPYVDIGIGINTGPMVVGNMGSQQRFSYTVMGDNVNLASRLEGLNKEYGTHVLVAEATLRAAEMAPGGGSALASRELDAVRVKGKEEPARLYELRGRGEVPEKDRPLLDTYAHGLALYRQRRFAEAQIEFETCLALAPEDGPSQLFVARCGEMAESPPARDWDGVYRMAHK